MEAGIKRMIKGKGRRNQAEKRERKLGGRRAEKEEAENTKWKK